MVEKEMSDAILNDLMFEGMILHDLGQPYSADLELMERLAKRLVRRNGKQAKACRVT